MNLLKLLRYNLRVVLSHNWWLLVFPIAVSQTSVFWTIITRKFQPDLPASSVELVSPLLAAFLCAHIMVAEYHSRVGAILASKPLHIGKVVLLRLASVLVLVWLLELLSLAAYYYGMEPYGIWPAFAASIPSTLFLSMLALTFATLFRNSLAGFAVAALYWVIDLAPGPPANAFLSLRSYSTFLSSIGANLDSLVSAWWVSKLLLLTGALVLYLIHGRLVFRLGAAPTLRARRRSIGWAAAVVCVYLLTGAAAKVTYGYSHRGRLEPSDGAWFRHQFAPYGPVPVATVFGSAFVRYLGDTNGWRSMTDEGDVLGDTLRHHRELREVVDTMPNSIWAPSAAELLGRLTSRQGSTVEERVSVFDQVANEYPNSPYVEVALREKARIYDAAEQQDAARVQYEELLKRRPATRYRNEALRYIVMNEQAHKNVEGVVQWARRWADAAHVEEKTAALAALAEAQYEQGDRTGARETANSALRTAKQALSDIRSGEIAGSESARLKWERETRESEGRCKALLQRLGG